MEIQEFAVMLGALAVATGHQLDKATISVYYDSLKDHSDERLTWAVEECCRTCKWKFPTAGYINSVAEAYEPKLDNALPAKSSAPKDVCPLSVYLKDNPDMKQAVEQIKSRGGETGKWFKEMEERS